jgi:hypothetical protein
MQTRIHGLNDSFETPNDREMLATRRVILRKLSARMKEGGFEAEKSSEAPALMRGDPGETIPAH